MAKSDLLKEAIADARAVKETALANAKIALQEAFAPRIESMLSAKLAEELGDEEENDFNDDLEDVTNDDTDSIDGEEDSLNAGAPEEVGVGLDFDLDGEYDLTGDLGVNDDEDNLTGDHQEEDSTEDHSENPEDEYNDDDLELESIIRELEGDLAGNTDGDQLEEGDEYEAGTNTDDESEEDDEDYDINEIIESILREDEMANDENETESLRTELNAKEAELTEAYNVVKQMQTVIKEVNLLNAKLLYTNKLFRNFDLNESQKMKVLENFDRAGNTREVKLVFSTLAESFNKPVKKRVVKESYASKPVASTKPNTNTPIITEGFAQADRWKKLAGLL